MRGARVAAAAAVAGAAFGLAVVVVGVVVVVVDKDGSAVVGLVGDFGCRILCAGGKWPRRGGMTIPLEKSSGLRRTVWTAGVGLGWRGFACDRDDDDGEEGGRSNGR